MLRGTIYDYVRDDSLNAQERAVGHQAADAPVAVRRQRRRPDEAETAPSTSATSSNALLDQTGLATITDANVAVINARLDAVGYPRTAHHDGHLSQSGRHDQRARRRSITSSALAISSASATAAMASAPPTHAARAGLSAPTASSDLDNADQALAISNTLILSPRTVLETRAQIAHGDLKAPPSDRDRPGRQHRRRGVVRHQLEQPDRPPQQDVSDRQQPLAPARRACVSCRRRLSLQRRLDHLPAIGARQLHVLVARQLPVRHLQQRRLRPDLRRQSRLRKPIRISACTSRTNGKSRRR